MVAPLALRDPAIADILSFVPLGSFWRCPAHEAAGRADLVQQDLWPGALAIGVLLVLWIASLAHMLRPTRRVPRAAPPRVPGWFRRLLDPDRGDHAPAASPTGCATLGTGLHSPCCPSS